MTNVLNLIGGERVGDPQVTRRNPADPGEVVAVAPSSDASDVDAALTAAVEAQAAWAAMPAPARGAILLDAADLLRSRQAEVAADLSREEGKTVAEATGEVRRAIDVLRFFGSLGWRASGEVLPSAMPGTTIFTRQEPLGVAALITPWNFPIAIPAWKLAPALITGNTVVLKPAELTPLSAAHLSNALMEAGLPAGVLNVVHGKGSVVGDALARDRRVAALSFTGSTGVGLGLHRILSERRARIQLEMGGKNAYLVLDDADPAAAAKVVAASAFSLTGQACTATSRVYCTPAVLEPFLDALAKEAETITMGPVVSEQQLAVDLAAIDTAKTEGATVVSGGEAPSGLFLRPTVLTGLSHDSSVVRDEIFGPVVAVFGVDSYEEGLSRVNDSRYGLTAGICTRDLNLAHHFAAHAQVGVVKINRPTTGLDLNVPFGGVKDSSSNTFREQGTAALDFYTWSKTVYLGHG
ncbi:aldehyde dehydrogenase family protein [Thermostaphylospora chromogena]|uniref:Aldehyde dehydrogenase (NAD+) n=1 Tax=Thermostaphylospora chromogena TaxID=35622 RepID=A0A1H1GR38_9ACTN|nr:aldehyde dehydrogenase family protein [Thermostaphylospora chromogena]SDR15657.1 aldehyde dehydrogenase (NAD+) [Thermostaphylospora chromogena]